MHRTVSPLSVETMLNSVKTERRAAREIYATPESVPGFGLEPTHTPSGNHPGGGSPALG